MHKQKQFSFATQTKIKISGISAQKVGFYLQDCAYLMDVVKGGVVEGKGKR